MNLRNWLRRSPVPTSIRCYTAQGPRDIVIEADNPRRWAHAEASVIALCPEAIEALSADGKTLRATNLENTAVESEEEEGAKAKSAKESELVLVAGLIKEAYRDGASQHAEAFEKSFGPMLQMVAVMSDRLAGLEKALFKSYANLQRNSEQPEEGAEGAMMGMFQAFMQGQQAKVAAAKAAKKAATNGHAATNGAPAPAKE